MTIPTSKSLFEQIAEVTAYAPTRTAFIFLDGDGTHTPVSADTFISSALKWSAQFVDAGVTARDVVAIATDNPYVTSAAFLGCLAIGAIPSIVATKGPRSRPSDIDRYIAVASLVQPRLLVSDSPNMKFESLRARGIQILVASDMSIAGARAAVPHRPQPSDIAFVQLSSGSTAKQKAIALSHTAVSNLVAARNEAFGLTSDDVIVGWVPLSHDLGIVGGVLGPLLTGVTSVIIPTYEWLSKPSLLMQAVSQFSGTVTTMPNFAFSYCTERIDDCAMQGFDLGPWRLLCSAAEPIRLASIERFCTRFARWGFRESSCAAAYGLAENTLTVTMTPRGRPILIDRVTRDSLQAGCMTVPTTSAKDSLPVVSCGRPLPHVQIAIQSHAAPHAFLPDRHIGDIVIRSTSLFSGYYNSAPPSKPLRDGWFFTGDVGYIADGELYVCGRRSDVIVIGGANVYSEEIETVLEPVAALRPGRVVAFGVPDATLGTDRIVVVAELADDASESTDDLKTLVRRTVHHMCNVSVAHVTFVPRGWIHKTTSGKIARWENREKWLSEFGLICDLRENCG